MNSHCNEWQGTPDNIGLAYGLVAVVAISSPFLLTWFNFNPSKDK